MNEYSKILKKHLEYLRESKREIIAIFPLKERKIETIFREKTIVCDSMYDALLSARKIKDSSIDSDQMQKITSCTKGCIVALILIKGKRLRDFEVENLYATI